MGEKILKRQSELREKITFKPEYIDKLGDETEKLNQTIYNFHEIAENHKWELFKDEWNEVSNSQGLIEDDIKFLAKVKSSLSKDILNENDINSTANEIVKQM